MRMRRKKWAVPELEASQLYIKDPASFSLGTQLSFTFSGATAHVFDRETQKNLEA